MASMIESVKARRRGAQDFEGYYSQLCALQDTCPLSAVKAHLDDGVLDLNADRVRQLDWMPVLNALRINRSLQFIGIRSYYQPSSKQEDSRSRSQTQLRRPPPIRSRDLTHRLSIALRECLSNSEQLDHVELQGLLLREKNVVSLCKGLAKTKCLQHLSLEYCRIGDAGVENLCQCIKNVPTIVSLNLTAAGLTSKSADILAKLIKRQATKRHAEAWKDSLRYRRPDLDRMPGIRRITINNNPLVNDKGAMALAEALKDDLWLKALDMQHCGVSNVGAKAFLDTLHQNTSVTVLDLRRNPLIDRDLLKAVIEQVMINSGGQENEFKWLRARSPRETSSKQRIKRRGRTGSAASKKTGGSRSSMKTAPSQTTERRTRSKSDSRIVIHTVSGSKSDVQPAVTRPGPGFVPWRTAARASQRSKGMVAGDPGSPEGSSTPTRPRVSSVHVHIGSSSAMSSELDTSIKDSMGASFAHTSASAADEGGGQEAIVGRKMKDLQVEAEDLRRRLYIESRARAAADAHIVELEVENSRLKHHLQVLEARGPTSPLKKGGSSRTGNGEEENGEDDALLESIEESFRKFHGFLDLLRDAGLGQLCTLVGLSPQDLGHPLVKSILKNHQPSAEQGPRESSTYQPRHLVYPAQTMQAHLFTGVQSQVTPGMMLNGQVKQHGNQMPPGGFSNMAEGMHWTGPGVYPQQMNNTGTPVPQHQMYQVPLNQITAAQMQQYHQPFLQPILANQPQSHQDPTSGVQSRDLPDDVQRVQVSAAQPQPPWQESSSLSSVPKASVNISSRVPVSVALRSSNVPPESLSSTEGVFVPSVVQFDSGEAHSKQEKSSDGSTSAQTVRPQETWQELDEADTLHPEFNSEVDAPRGQGEEPELQKAPDSLDFDPSKVRQITELNFDNSAESTPRIPESKDVENRVESATPTRGIGSPTESEHSARGARDSSGGQSHSPSYSEDFEGSGNDDESDIEEDLFKDSEGSLPGLTSDEEF